MRQPLIDRKDYGENGMDQLERQYEAIKHVDPSLISDEQSQDFQKRITRTANNVLNLELKNNIVTRVINESINLNRHWCMWSCRHD